MASPRWSVMNRSAAIMHYTTAILIFRHWVAEGIIEADEMAIVESVLANKYGLPDSSIFRLNA